MRGAVDITRGASIAGMARACVCLERGAFRSGLRGILAGPPGEDGTRYVERCDTCEVFGSDEAACREYVRVHGGLCCFDSDLKVFWLPR